MRRNSSVLRQAMGQDRRRETIAGWGFSSENLWMMTSANGMEITRPSLNRIRCQ
jgi:hypothetical protein